MTKRDRDLWIHDCRWRVRLADAEHKHAVERLRAACDEHDNATRAEQLAREVLQQTTEQLATAESGKRARKGP